MTVGAVARNEATEAFFEGTAGGRFGLLRCPSGHFNRPQAVLCAECRSVELEQVPASGRVRLVSWAVVPARPGTGSSGQPSIPAVVEFEEGPWWWGPLVGADPAGLVEGQELELSFERPEGSEAVPVFRPRS